MIKIGYMGIPFSNSAEMSQRFADAYDLGECEHIPLMSAKGVVDALMEDMVDYGVLAISNRFAGTVVESEEAQEGQPIETLLTEWTHIHHCVFVKSENTKVTKIISHIQALLQSKNSLGRLFPDAELVECEDTAYAAEIVANGTVGPEYAAVCRRDAGEHYGLILLHKNIEDNGENMTQFSLIRKV